MKKPPFPDHTASPVIYNAQLANWNAYCLLHRERRIKITQVLLLISGILNMVQAILILLS